MKKSWCGIALCISSIFLQEQAFAVPASEQIANLATRCAPDVSPLTMAYIVGHESENGPYRIHVNGDSGQLPKQPRNESEAIDAAKELLNKGVSFDMGLGQINSKNLPGLGIPVDRIFNPCKNLQASQTILKACYYDALKTNPPGQVALRHALSCYNTGSQVAGILNGYVTKVINVAKQSNLRVPTLLPEGETEDAASQPVNAERGSYEGEKDAFTDSGERGGDVFSQDNTDAFISRSGQKGGEVMHDKNISPSSVASD